MQAIIFSELFQYKHKIKFIWGTDFQPIVIASHIFYRSSEYWSFRRYSRSELFYNVFYSRLYPSDAFFVRSGTDAPTFIKLIQINTELLQSVSISADGA